MLYKIFLITPQETHILYSDSVGRFPNTYPITSLNLNALAINVSQGEISLEKYLDVNRNTGYSFCGYEDKFCCHNIIVIPEQNYCRFCRNIVKCEDDIKDHKFCYLTNRKEGIYWHEDFCNCDGF